MRVFRGYLDVEVKKLAAGRPTKFPDTMVLEMAADALWKQRRANESEDSVALLERLYRLEDPRG